VSEPAYLPYDPPAASELLSGLRDFFAEEVVPALEEPLRYHVRVAVGVLAQVGRELELGPSRAETHHRRLKSFGVASDSELAQAIRSGAFDHRFNEVRVALKVDVEEKVRVSNPVALAAETLAVESSG
jgi:hypothetical protein